MLLIILVMLAGILAGFFAVSKDKTGKILSACGRMQQAATVALLFAMGLWLGGNPDFWRDIKSIGFFGALFAVVTIAGSVLAVYLLSKLPSKGAKK